MKKSFDKDGSMEGKTWECVARIESGSHLVCDEEMGSKLSDSEGIMEQHTSANTKII